MQLADYGTVPVLNTLLLLYLMVFAVIMAGDSRDAW